MVLLGRVHVIWRGTFEQGTSGSTPSGDDVGLTVTCEQVDLARLGIQFNVIDTLPGITVVIESIAIGKTDVAFPFRSH